MNQLLMHSMVFSLVLLSPRLSYSDTDHDKAKNLLDSGNILPLQSILEKAHNRYSGKILEVELEEKNQQLVYEIELLLDNGLVLELYFNAKTGQYLASKKED